MLSLKKTINRLDEEDQLFRAALGAYVSAIAVIRNLPLATDAESIRAYKESLRELQAQLNNAHDAEVLDRSRDALRDLVEEYRAKAEALALQKEEDLRAVIEALGEATQVLKEQHSGQAGRLGAFTDRLQESVGLPDLGQMRRRITSHVRDLRQISDQHRRENESAIASFRTQLAEFTARLDRAERRASLDGLTGLINRGEGEARLETLVAAGDDLTAVLVDLNNFKKINDTWGHAAGDQVLKTSARILANFFRPGDLVCRWGGDEFLAVLKCGEQAIRERVSHLDAQLRVPQKVVVLGKLYELTASAAIGVAKWLPGESAADFVARVDADMYRGKGSASVCIAG
jgi:diguanylate cyclase (GGDEF)-like protein